MLRWPEKEFRSVPEPSLPRRSVERELPFFASFEIDNDFAEEDGVGE